MNKTSQAWPYENLTMSGNNADYVPSWGRGESSRCRQGRAAGKCYELHVDTVVSESARQAVLREEPAMNAAAFAQILKRPAAAGLCASHLPGG